MRPTFAPVVVGLSLVLSGGCGKDRVGPSPYKGNATGTGTGASGTGASGTGASGGDGVGGSADAPAYTLTLVVDDGPWQVTQMTTGIAVDEAGIVYISDRDAVYAVDGSDVSVYMTDEEAGMITNQAYHSFSDLDLASDGALYLLAGDAIVRSAAPHQGTVHRDLTGLNSEFMSVASPDLIGIIEYYDGMYAVTPDGASLVYDSVDIATGCATEELTMLPSGVFLYHPGCNSSPLLHGNIDGSGTNVIFDEDVNTENMQNFNCSARAPDGGFFVVANIHGKGTSHQKLFHFAADVTEESGVQALVTSPTFQEAEEADGSDSITFNYCALAAAPGGSLYLQTFEQLWVLEPI